jgi:cytochrome P450
MAKGFWVVSRHADCVAAAGHDQLHPAHRAGRAALDGMDGARYEGLRKLLGPGLSAAAMRGVEDEVRWTAEQLVGAAARVHGADAVSGLATPLAFRTLARVLGVPERDRGALQEVVAAALDDGADAESAHDAVRSYGRKLIGRKRKHPGADIISKAIHAHVHDAGAGGDHLDGDEVLRLFDLLVTAGIDTTRDAIAGGVLALAEHPDQWAVLRADRSQLRHATEEILRWTSPTPCDWRYALCDLEVAGRLVPAGDRVTLWWASANRDERVFADADAFVVTRDPNPHVAFGHGAHGCFGAALARLEIRLLLDVLLEHVEAVRLAAPPEWACGSEHSSLRHLAVTFDQ